MALTLLPESWAIRACHLMAAIWHGSASQRLGKLTPPPPPDMDGATASEGRGDGRSTGAVAKYARERRRERGRRQKAMESYLTFFFSLFLSGKVGNADRILREWPHGWIVPVPVGDCSFKRITIFRDKVPFNLSYSVEHMKCLRG